MPKPHIVKQTAPLPLQASRVRSCVPEHDFTLKLPEWELIVFDRAEKFVVSWFKGRFNKGSQDYGTNFDEAVKACAANDRAVIYAVTPVGRSVCLSRSDWPMLLTRWKNRTEGFTTPSASVYQCSKQGDQKMTYLLHWTGVQTDVVVAKFADAAAAHAYLSSMPEDRNGCVLDTENDFPIEISKTVLVRLYNALSPTQINTFANRTVGMQRVWHAVVATGMNIPLTTVKEFKVTAEPTTEKKERKQHEPQPTGAGKALRDGTIIAKILREVMKGKHTIAQIAETTGVAEANVKHRINHVLRVSYGIESEVGSDGVITCKLPKGFTHETIIIAKEVEEAVAA